MKLLTYNSLILATLISSVAGELPSQLVADITSYHVVSYNLRDDFESMAVDYADKSQLSSVINNLRLLGQSINALNTTATDLAAQSSLLAPDDAAHLVDQFNLIAGNTTNMITALVTRTYFCQNYGYNIDSVMVPAKETIYLSLDSLGRITPEPYQSQLTPIRTSLTNSYYKALVYRNYYHNFDRACIPWGTWNL